MAERVETVVVGGGQAGLSVSALLAEHDREHVVLERGRVGETWRTRCWDGFRLNTPNWTLQLPRRAYDGPEPNRFGTAAELLEFFEAYAAAQLDGAGLTRREREVRRLVTEGKTNRDVAGALFLSTRTIDMHVRNILGKLGCRSRAEASRKADELGLLS
jgi:DNA-binding CsgD family transcriptional regulator